ncbi:MAG TPA: Asp-tRNA(Asn)/Glu-tRNA(Gln) amidotransferase subunit GatC [Polyangiaceae bacterium]|nr:Asp-tRNA(Asn)/Glu-tRNA(Gln) amidotransferase subunit GatC [Polyangiaceae bacterium]
MPKAQVDRSLVEHVARLASLSLSAAELDRLAKDVARIVEYFEQLDALDTRDVPPTAHVRLDRAAWRADETAACLTRDEALAQAPRVEGDGFAVPAFVD